MRTHKQLVKTMLANSAVRKEYDALVKARAKAGLTQAEVAQRMGTHVPAVSRLESGGGGARHSPSVTTLRNYAKAVGCDLVIKLQPTKQKRAA